MGAWGYRAYDNDEACDWLCEIEQLVTKKIETALTQKSPHTLVAAAGLLAELDGPPLDLSYDAHQRNLFNRVHDALERLLTEPIQKQKTRVNGRYLKRPKTAIAAWSETWDEPELAKQMLNILMQRLRMAEMEEVVNQTRVSHVLRRHRPKGKKRPAEKKP